MARRETSLVSRHPAVAAGQGVIVGREPIWEPSPTLGRTSADGCGIGRGADLH